VRVGARSAPAWWRRSSRRGCGGGLWPLELNDYRAAVGETRRRLFVEAHIREADVASGG
jgi:hypothetical protein